MSGIIQINKSEFDIDLFSIQGSVLQIKVKDKLYCFLHNFTSSDLYKLTKQSLKDFILLNKDQLNIRARRTYTSRDVQDGDKLIIT
jgi:hypothetical protein